MTNTPSLTANFFFSKDFANILSETHCLSPLKKKSLVFDLFFSFLLEKVIHLIKVLQYSQFLPGQGH